MAKYPCSQYEVDNEDNGDGGDGDANDGDANDDDDAI